MTDPSPPKPKETDLKVTDEEDAATATLWPEPHISAPGTKTIGTHAFHVQATSHAIHWKEFLQTEARNEATNDGNHILPQLLAEYTEKLILASEALERESTTHAKYWVMTSLMFFASIVIGTITLFNSFSNIWSVALAVTNAFFVLVSLYAVFNNHTHHRSRVRREKLRLLLAKRQLSKIVRTCSQFVEHGEAPPLAQKVQMDLRLVEAEGLLDFVEKEFGSSDQGHDDAPITLPFKLFS